MFLNLSAYMRSPPRKKGVLSRDLSCDINPEVININSAINTKRIRELTANPALAYVGFIPPGTRPAERTINDTKENDVICGRGGGINGLIGNRRYRNVITMYQRAYITVERKSKPLVARVIVETIRKRGGRFLKKDENTGMMFEIGDDKAEAKTSQALRDGIDAATNASLALKRMQELEKYADSRTKYEEFRCLEDEHMHDLSQEYGTGVRSLYPIESDGRRREHCKPIIQPHPHSSDEIKLRSSSREVLGFPGTYPAQVTPLSSHDFEEEDCDIEPFPYTPMRKKNIDDRDSHSPNQKIISPLSVSLQSTLQSVLFHTPFKSQGKAQNKGTEFLKCSPIVSPDKKKAKRWSDKNVSTSTISKQNVKECVPKRVKNHSLCFSDEGIECVYNDPLCDLNDPFGFYENNVDIVGYEKTSGVWYC